MKFHHLVIQLLLALIVAIFQSAEGFHVPLIRTDFGTSEKEIAIWTLAFATTHIGMSAIRNDVIRACGEVAGSLHLVNNTQWLLPDVWPGDKDGGQTIFPNKEIAGRQLYRAAYTAVSFTTLGSAFLAYVDSVQQNPPQLPASETSSVLLVVATLSSATSIASLLNPSPLSLVPVFEGSVKDTDNISERNNQILQRNDARKLTAYGMTRITRHPLILPVVPWGFATALSLGGQSRDYLLFGGLAVYAIAGCYAQDLRVARQEGSVGTIFDPDDNLQTFFRETSFVPFQAVLDGRQSVVDIAQEVPWLGFLAGVAIGYNLQSFLLRWIVSLGF